MKFKELADLVLSRLSGVSFVRLNTVTSQTSLNKGGQKGVPKMVETIKMLPDGSIIKAETATEGDNSIFVDPDGIKKHTKIVGLISSGGCSYEDFVNNRITKEAKADGKEYPQLVFKALPRTWGERLNPALVVHKGAFYLTLFCLANNKVEVEYFFNGVSIDIKNEIFNTWRKPKKKEGENQGTKDPIIVRDYAFTSIRLVKIFGEENELVTD